MKRPLFLILLALLLVPVQSAVSASAGQQAPTAAAAATANEPTANQKALLDRYCVTCHNARLKTADLSLENLDVTTCRRTPRPGKRSSASCAPAPCRRPAGRVPTRHAYASMVSWLETEIDRDASAHPNPGRTESLHRLNRAEYRNAVRDLLALDIDVASLLPADDMSYGFDNIAGVLKITPSLLDRYMAAARQISRVAIGNPTIAPTAETFRLKADLSQDMAFDESADRHARRHGDSATTFRSTPNTRSRSSRSAAAPTRTSSKSASTARACKLFTLGRAARSAAPVRATTRKATRSKSACRSRPARTSSA